MICIIALVVFAILAVFSAKYRPLAAESFDCVFRRVTFRKCNSNLDKRLKSQIVGSVLKHHKRAGRFVYKYFEIFSWFFLIMMVLSTVQVGFSVYNYAAFGNCNGPDETGFCIFDPLGTNQQEEVSICAPDDYVPEKCPPGVPAEECDFLKAPSIFELASNPKTGSAAAKVTVIEFGCFACPNTVEQAPAVKKLIEYFGADIQFVYVDFPLEQHVFALEAALAAHCVQEQDDFKYWQYHFTIFNNPDDLSNENLFSWAEDLGVDMNKFTSCLVNPITSVAIDNNVALAKKAGIFGTPTFFIDDESLVGVKPYKLLRSKINTALDANN